MTESNPRQPAETPQPQIPAAAPTPEELAALRFYEGAESRLSRWLIGSALIIVVLLPAISLRAAGGFAVGAVLSFINFRWLHRSARKATEAMAKNALSSGKASVAGAGIGIGAMLRLALVMGAGYVIFKSSVESFYGYVGGLSISMLAIFAEAFYELWVAVRRGY